MKDQRTSTALVGAIAGTTAKTLDRIYDAPTWRRQQGLAAKVFTPVATALLQAAPAAAEEAAPAAAAEEAAPAAAEEGPLPAKFCAQCGRARSDERWACCPWCGCEF